MAELPPSIESLTMSLRKKYDERCVRCYMRFELCLCTSIPTLATTTKIVFIIGKREAKIPTNTGRLASLALANSVVLIHGDRDQPYNLAPHLSPSGHNMVLYPAPEAIELTSDFCLNLNQPPLSRTLIVPDGNWRQTSKMRRRNPLMVDLPIVKVPPGDASVYRVRKESKAEGLATIEAVARALGVLEGPAVQESLEQLLQIMVTRTLRSRGVEV